MGDGAGVARDREECERAVGDGAEGDEASPTRAAIAAVGSRAEVVAALEDVTAMEVSTKSAVFECSGRLERCAAIQESILLAI
ncbi:MAG: hypothetical protein F4213_01880 [Boseongicola sp. SB0677_bin_26]|nr:hypothetical protein [Boseongicola sp. SB0665_bin_10]MYG24765.1 hypothetical protein [Boseongicola sp. SB0677_bin_26]